MPPWLVKSLDVSLTLTLVALNGFFVAAEFALVKVRGSQINELIEQRRPFAKTAKWLMDRLEPSLSTCQLGITMASLALGWIGEPAFEVLLGPVFRLMAIESETVIHTLSVIAAFTLITAFHLVIGEQAPKIFAIRKPAVMLLWCALPLKFFFVFSYPLMALLNWTTTLLLNRLGLEEASEHGIPVSEKELRLMLRESHLHGHITRSEHSLIDAVFEFDDMVCRRVMVLRNEVEFFDVNEPFSTCLEIARRTKHTRYPLCDGSMDDVIGVVHIKDLVGIPPDSEFDLRTVARPPKKVPENMPISKLLRHFQVTHQLVAFVLDEYGNVIGIVTLENVLEEIIGDVDDEFDVKQEEIVPAGHNTWIIRGSASAEDVLSELGIKNDDYEADTFSGLLTDMAARILVPGDEIELHGFTARVLEVRDDRASRVKVERKLVDS